MAGFWIGHNNIYLKTHYPRAKKGNTFFYIEYATKWLLICCASSLLAQNLSFNFHHLHLKFTARTQDYVIEVWKQTFWQYAFLVLLYRKIYFEAKDFFKTKNNRKKPNLEYWDSVRY